MNSEIVAIIIIIIILLTIHYIKNRHLIEVQVPGGEETYIVSTKFEDYKDAVKLLSRVNRKTIEILRYLKKKYVPNEFTGKRMNNDVFANDMQKIVQHMLKNYNPEVIIENIPGGNDTSYTINKGQKLYMCIRNKVTHQLIDEHTVTFVLLHELSHIGHYYGWGHGKSYWEVFKFVLYNAEESGLYTSQNYRSRPVVYCGLNVNYNPLLDPNIKNIWETGIGNVETFIENFSGGSNGSCSQCVSMR